MANSSKININIDAEFIEINPVNVYNISVNLINVSKQELLCQFSVEDILTYFDNESLLKNIGISRCKDYFGLIEDEG